jgi:hypothetical protein
MELFHRGCDEHGERRRLPDRRLLAPRWLARFDGRHVLLAGGFATGGLLALHAVATDDALLYALRALSGSRQRGDPLFPAD